MSISKWMPNRTKSIVSAVVLSMLMSLAPQADAMKARCWEAGTSPWIDGHIYCMIAGGDCSYCEVTP